MKTGKRGRPKKEAVEEKDKKDFHEILAERLMKNGKEETISRKEIEQPEPEDEEEEKETPGQKQDTPFNTRINPSQISQIKATEKSLDNIIDITNLLYKEMEDLIAPFEKVNQFGQLVFEARLKRMMASLSHEELRFHYIKSILIRFANFLKNLLYSELNLITNLIIIKEQVSEIKNILENPIPPEFTNQRKTINETCNSMYEVIIEWKEHEIRTVINNIAEKLKISLNSSNLSLLKMECLNLSQYLMKKRADISEINHLRKSLSLNIEILKDYL